jgi:Ni2+-binding GTPase involved in maturation of urease and hydrogenase
VARDLEAPVPVLVVTGPVGVGKTSVAEEIFDQLAARDVPHAVVDLDALGLTEKATPLTSGWPCRTWPLRGRTSLRLELAVS